MTIRKWIGFIGLAAASAGASAQPESGISLTHYEGIQSVVLSAAGAGRLPGTAIRQPLALSFAALGQAFDLRLEPNAGLLAAMTANDFARDLVPYTGRIEGIADSWASIVLNRGVPSGLIFDGQELYAIEAPGDSLAASSEVIIYRVADAVVAPGALSCASGSTMQSGAEVFEKTVGNLKTAVARAPGALSEIDIGAIGDFEFSSEHGDPAAAILTRLNNVDVIYSAQLGVQINVPLIEVFPANDDPFDDTKEPLTLLEQLSDYRIATPAQRSQGLTHLYTGRDLTGQTVGIAYTGAVCQSFGVGLSEGNGSPTFDSLIAAHEIGHNFGAPHDGDGACADQDGEFIMAPLLNDSQEFSACSIEQMEAVIADANCVTALPSTDISIAYNASPATILLTNAANVTFDIVNSGSEAATSVVADISLPGNVELVAASGSAATCTDGAGMVSCAFGSVAGGSAASVTISATTTAVGTDSFDASVTADADDNNGNNTAAAEITVDPAVEMVLNAPAPATVTEGQRTTVAISFENQSSLDATNVTLGIDLGQGLRADSASWPIGSCSVTVQQVTCEATRFDGLSSAELSLSVTGLSPGAPTYTVAVDSSETDADPANNSVAGSVRVNAAGNAGNDSGGGGFGLLFLAALCAAAWRRISRAI